MKTNILHSMHVALVTIVILCVAAPMYAQYSKPKAKTTTKYTPKKTNLVAGPTNRAYHKSKNSKKQPHTNEHDGRLYIGLGGGVASTLPKTDASSTNQLRGDCKAPLGWEMELDVRYAHFWHRSVDLGIMTGLDFGLMQQKFQGAWLEQYSEPNAVNGQIDYTISVDAVNQKLVQFQVGVPIMFAMRTEKGFFLNAGPKLLFPCMSVYNQTLTNPNILAYFPEERVPVLNEDVTGVVTQIEKKGISDYNGKLHLLLGLETGYEIRLNNQQSLLIGAYFNYGVFSAYKRSHRLVEVTAPTTAAPLAEVKVYPISDAAFSKLNYLDAGIKVTYSLPLN